VSAKNFIQFAAMGTMLCLAPILPTASAWAQTAPAAQAATGPTGWWIDGSGKAGILIAPCGADLCGKIEWLRNPLNPQGQKKTDVHNPNPALQGRLLCGLPILGNFTQTGPASWGGGWIYDPEGGKTYKSQMKLPGNGTLAVRGYIGIPLLGRSESWTRPAAPLTPCA
jgi:uncharacterized protein (DUF2147 family)